MTIYATEYDNETKEVGPSMDSGFESLEQVEQAFGVVRKYPRMVMIDKIVYSHIVFRVDGSATTG